MTRRFPEMQHDVTTFQVTVGGPLGKGEGHITAAGFSDQESAELAKNISEEFMVDVAEDAAGCCIDGRQCIHTLAETDPTPGASVAGGPLVTAYGAAELVGDYFSDTSAETTLGRVEEVKATITNGGIVVGAHVADGAVANKFQKIDMTTGEPTGEPQTGCGASDEFKGIMATPADEKEFIEGATTLLLGDEYNYEFMNFTPKGQLLKRVEGYDSYDMLRAVAASGKEQNVEVLTGKHAEVLVVFNYSEGKTVDRDRLVSETGRQVFVIDMWYIDKLARAMAEGRPDASAMYPKLKHAMTAFQVATYLRLCDGTHRPVLLSPQR